MVKKHVRTAVRPVFRGGMFWLCGCLLAGFFAGCRAGTPSPAEASAIQTLTFYHWDTENQEIYELLARRYTERHPDVEILIECTEPQKYTSAWLKAARRNKLADVFMVPAGSAFESFVDTEKLYDLSGCDAIWAQYSSDLLEIGTRDAHIWALPVTQDIPVIFYNKDIYRQYKLVEPFRPDDLLINCELLKAQKIIPLAVADKKEGEADIAGLAEALASHFSESSPAVRAGSLLDADGRINRSVYDAAAVLQSLYQEKYLHSVSGRENVFKRFVQGEYAMIIGTAAMEHKIKELSSDFAYGMFYFSDTPQGAPKIALADIMLGISKDTEEIDRAVDFLAYLSSADCAGQLCAQTGRLPAVKNAASRDFGETEQTVRPEAVSPSFLQRLQAKELTVCLQRLHKAARQNIGDTLEYFRDWEEELQ